MGILGTVLIQLVIYFYPIQRKIKHNIKIIFKNLSQLNVTVFSCLLEQEYIDHVYFYEHRLHADKSRFMRSLQQFNNCLHRLKHDYEINFYTALGNKIDLLFNNMMDYSQLRRRVTDFTTLSLCSQELTGILQEITKLINQVILSDVISLDLLEKKINNLEDNYHHILQVASREPLVFLLFIGSLHNFGKNLTNIARMMHDAKQAGHKKKYH